MYFVKKNIMDFVKNHLDIFVVFFMVQIISVFLIFFIYGLMVNYQKELDNMTYDTFNFEVTFNDENGKTDFTPLKKAITEMLEEMGNKVNGLCVLGRYEDGNIKYYINAHDGYSNDGKFCEPEFCNPFDIKQGRGLDNKDFQGDELVAITNSKKFVNHQVEIAGNRYNVIGRYAYTFDTEDTYFEIPYRFLPEKNYTVIYFRLNFKKNPTEKEYEMFKSVIGKYCGEGHSFEELYLDKPARKKALKSMNLVALIIGALSSVNLVVIYVNLIEKRRKKNAIIQICGYAYGKMCRALFVEIELLNMCSFIVGISIFFVVYKLSLVKIFTYFGEVFTALSIIKLALIYLGITTVVALFLSRVMNKKEPLQLLRRSYYV